MAAIIEKNNKYMLSLLDFSQSDSRIMKNKTEKKKDIQEAKQTEKPEDKKKKAPKRIPKYKTFSCFKWMLAKSGNGQNHGHFGGGDYSPFHCSLCP